MPRPKKPEAEQLTERVGFRLTKADFDIYSEKCKTSGLTESQFFRECVLTNRTTLVQKSDEPAKILFTVKKASNNINQIANRLHVDALAERVSEDTYIRVLEELKALTTYLKAAL